MVKAYCYLFFKAKISLEETEKHARLLFQLRLGDAAMKPRRNVPPRRQR